MLSDGYNRTFQYLRLSITEACNFKCAYCLPNGFRPTPKMEGPLTLAEITRLAKAFSTLGFTKVRLTGGEPTIRSDILDIIIMLKAHFKEVALSTNGYRLPWLVPGLRDAGLTAVNVSFDSLNEIRFNSLTGRNMYKNVRAGIDAILDSGFATVKLNAVLLKSTWQQELESFVDWVHDRQVCVRFIELMQTPTTREFFKTEHIPASLFEASLVQQGWHSTTRTANGGPAREFQHSHHSGRIGLIAPYEKSFCASCNRLRISSRGALKLCLFGDRDHSLRAYLQSDADHDALVERVRSLIVTKPQKHWLANDQFGSIQSLSQIGG